MEKQHFEMILESIDSKFNLVLEGHDALRQEIREEAEKNEERFKLVDFKFDVLNKKIDGVAADLKATDERLNNKIDSVEQHLSKKIDGVEINLTKHINEVAADLKAHRADTEAHHGVYRVKEGT